MSNDAAAHAQLTPERIERIRGHLLRGESLWPPVINELCDTALRATELQRAISEHNIECQRLCQSRDCGFKPYRRQCPECPLDGLVL